MMMINSIRGNLLNSKFQFRRRCFFPNIDHRVRGFSDKSGTGRKFETKISGDGGNQRTDDRFVNKMKQKFFDKSGAGRKFQPKISGEGDDGGNRRTDDSFVDKIKHKYTSRGNGGKKGGELPEDLVSWFDSLKALAKVGTPILGMAKVLLMARNQYSPRAKILAKSSEKIQVLLPAPGIEVEQMKIWINKKNQLEAVFSNDIPPRSLVSKFVKIMKREGADDEDDSRFYKYIKSLTKVGNFEKATYKAVKNRNSDVIVTITNFTRENVFIQVKDEMEVARKEAEDPKSEKEE